MVSVISARLSQMTGADELFELILDPSVAVDGSVRTHLRALSGRDVPVGMAEVRTAWSRHD